MWTKKRTSLALMGALTLIVLWGCAPRLAPALPAGIALQPGRYLTASYRAPDFPANRTTYALEPFTMAAAQGVAPETFQAQFQEELSRAFKDNGLKLDPQSDTRLAGTVQQVAVKGAFFRFIAGKISVHLVVSAAITRGDDLLFACQDRISLDSPVNPGPPAPREAELLLQQAARTFAVHLLNELLL